MVVLYSSMISKSAPSYQFLLDLLIGAKELEKIAQSAIRLSCSIGDGRTYLRDQQDRRSRFMQVQLGKLKSENPQRHGSQLPLLVACTIRRACKECVKV
jgi:hypothetical protein